MRYDYIVIGAHSERAILATRLNEDPNTSVLLLEDGLDYPDFDSIPNRGFLCRLGRYRGWPRMANATPLQRLV